MRKSPTRFTLTSPLMERPQGGSNLAYMVQRLPQLAKILSSCALANQDLDTRIANFIVSFQVSTVYLKLGLGGQCETLSNRYYLLIEILPDSMSVTCIEKVSCARAETSHKGTELEGKAFTARLLQTKTLKLHMGDQEL
jgi:hypothetical protein